MTPNHRLETLTWRLKGDKTKQKLTGKKNSSRLRCNTRALWRSAKMQHDGTFRVRVRAAGLSNRLSLWYWDSTSSRLILYQNCKFSFPSCSATIISNQGTSFVPQGNKDRGFERNELCQKCQQILWNKETSNVKWQFESTIRTTTGLQPQHRSRKMWVNFAVGDILQWLIIDCNMKIEVLRLISRAVMLCSLLGDTTCLCWRWMTAFCLYSENHKLNFCHCGAIPSNSLINCLVAAYHNSVKFSSFLLTCRLKSQMPSYINSTSYQNNSKGQ